jgi:glutamine synthetase
MPGPDQLGAELVAISFTDIGGIARVKAVPADLFDRTRVQGVGASTTFMVFRGDDLMASAHGLEVPVGDMRLMPDAGSLAGPVDGWAWAAADLHDVEGEPLPTCPRTFLRRMVARAEDAGLRISMAYETEWYAERESDGEPAHAGPGYGLATLAEAGSYLRAVAGRLAAYGVPVVQVHPEYSPGQMELSVEPSDPVAAADRVVLTRHAIRTAREATGVRASFAPLVRPELLGNGCHLHFSVWRGDDNLLDPAADDATGRAFLAGVLREVPALAAIGCASPLSWARIAPSRWTGAFTCWGVENREAPIRLIAGSRSARPASANAELKTGDPSGNPYLVAGAVIAAGLAGIADRAELPPPVDVDPARIPEAERAERGIHPLPSDADTAAAALDGSAALREALGDVLTDVIAAVRRSEAADAAGLTPEHLQERYRWRY